MTCKSAAADRSYGGGSQFVRKSIFAFRFLRDGGTRDCSSEIRVGHRDRHSLSISPAGRRGLAAGRRLSPRTRPAGLHHSLSISAANRWGNAQAVTVTAAGPPACPRPAGGPAFPERPRRWCRAGPGQGLGPGEPARPPTGLPFKKGTELEVAAVPDHCLGCYHWHDDHDDHDHAALSAASLSDRLAQSRVRLGSPVTRDSDSDPASQSVTVARRRHCQCGTCGPVAASRIIRP
jgi:hypothetical protein